MIARTALGFIYFLEIPLMISLLLVLIFGAALYGHDQAADMSVAAPCSRVASACLEDGAHK